MMMLPQKKKIATLIVASLKGKPKEEGPSVEPVSNEEPAEDYSLGLESAVEALFSAFEQKDVKAGVSALRDFMEMCDHSSEEEESMDESGEG